MIEAPTMPKTDLISILTGETCGEACWHAQEDLCRCSCGGKNHGILRNGGTQPERTCRNRKAIYKLISITSLFDHAKIVKEVGWQENIGKYPLRYGRKATASQLKWSEVRNIAPDGIMAGARCMGEAIVYLVWERVKLEL